MNKIEEIIAKLESIPDSFDQALLNIVEKHKSEALDMETSQLFSGRDSKDQSLGAYRSQSYAEFKKQLNQAGVVDLKLTGDFYRGFFAKTDNFPIQFGSTDEKSETLASKYGEDIFGLDPQNLEEFRQEIKPDLQEWFKGILQIR